MSDSILNIIINTVKRGGGDKETISNLVKMKNQFKDMTGINLSSLTAWALVGAAIAKVIDYTKKAIEKNDTYISTIVDGARLTKESLEETSRLYQVADDYFIKSTDLEKSLLAARKNGIDVSIEGLQNLSDQYLATGKDTKFLTDTFGKNGAEMAKLMELSGEKIRSEMDAVSESMVVDAKKVAITYAYKRSLDALNDANDAFAYNVAMGTMPAITALNTTMATFIEMVNNSGVVINALNWTITKATGALMFWDAVFTGQINKIPNIRQVLEDLQNQYAEVTEEQIAAAQLQGDFNDRLSELKTIMGGEFGEQMQTYHDKVKEIYDQQGEYALRIQELNSLKYLTPEQKEELEDLKAKIDENKTKLKELADEHAIAMKTMAMNMIIAKATSDGLTSNEITNIGKIMVAWGLWDEKTAEVVESINGIDLDQANTELDSVLGTLESIMGLPSEKNVTVTTTYNEVGGSGGGASANFYDEESSNSSDDWVLKGTKGGVGTDKAWYNGSSWYYGDTPPGAATGGMVKVGEYGTEVVKLPDGAFVYNHEQTQQMMGGINSPITINVNGISDPIKAAEEVERRLMEKIRLQTGGLLK